MYLTNFTTDHSFIVMYDTISMGGSKDGKDGKDKDSEKSYEKTKEKDIETLSLLYKELSFFKNKSNEYGELPSKDEFNSQEMIHQVIKVK